MCRRARFCRPAQPDLEHFLFENALLTRKRQPPQRGVHSGENRVFRLNATFDFHKKSKVICSKKAEVCAGGVDTREINPHGMASLRCAHLHVIGELLDVTGQLGGYNLHWAWASGVAAGRAVLPERCG